MNLTSRLNLFLRRCARYVPPDHPIRQGMASAWNRWLDKRKAPVSLKVGTGEILLTHHFRSLPESYENEALSLFLDRIRPGDVVWDIGAHIGIYSILGARKVGRHGKIYSIEASPEAYSFLAKHIALNKMSLRCQIKNIAISKDRGYLRFAVNGRDKQDQTNRLETGCTDHPYKELVKVPTYSLDSLAEFCDVPDWIKMDIEGAEVDALYGAEKLLSGKFGKRPSILVSVHPHFIWEYGHTMEHLDQLAARYQYKTYNLTGALSPLNTHAEFWMIPFTHD